MNNRVISIKHFKRIQAKIDLCATLNEDCDLCRPLKRQRCRCWWDKIVAKVPAKIGTYDFAESDTIKPSRGNPFVECMGITLPHGKKMRPLTMLDVRGCPTGTNSALSLR